MKVVVAPNSFKETLTAKEFIEIVKSEAKGLEIAGFPLSDGGDGFLDCVNGEIIKFETTGPVNKKVKTKVKKEGKRYYIESASIIGLRLLSPEQRNPKNTTSYGLGRLIKKIVKLSPKEIIIGFGGSSTVDFGIGALKALGIRFFDSEGNEVPDNATGIGVVERIDKSRLLEEVKNVKIICACDVENTGPDVIIYAPQKGADTNTVRMIRDGIKNIERIFGRNTLQIKHGGAAGGIPLFFNLLLGAELTSGSEFVIRESGYATSLMDAELVITGEGKIDNQTRFGKVPYIVAKLANEMAIPVIAIVGEIGKIDKEIEDMFTAIFSIAPGPMKLEDLMAETNKEVRRLSRQIFKLVEHLRRRARC